MHSKGQRIAALICIVLLVLLYIATLVFAIFNFDGKGVMFRTCLIATVVVPILTWVYIWIYGMLTQKHTIASVDFDITAGIDKDSVASESDTATEAGTANESTSSDS